MQKKFGAILLGISGFLLPSIAFAAPQTFSDLVHFFIGYINFIIPMVITAAVVLYMRNTATGLYDLSRGKANPDWKASMVWGIVILTMMVSLWGILTIIGVTFGF